MKSRAYRRFIREAYVDPLRSVLIVDDDYPTLEEALRPVEAGAREALVGCNQAKRWWSEPGPIQEVITRFRKSKPPMIVDVHDGTNLSQHDDAEVAEHLHQSDLLVLDYSLDKANPGNGDRAIQILRKVMHNKQYNLVVLHTSELLEDVFPTVLLALHAPASEFLTYGEEEEFLQHIGPAEVENPSIMDVLQRSLTLAHYLWFRRQKETWPDVADAEAPSAERFHTLALEAGFTEPRLRGLLAKMVLRRLEAGLKPQMSTAPLPNLTWGSGDRKWIRTDHGFVAFSSKPDKADLVDELVQALESSNPDPSRLFLAKIRSETDKNGLAESKALGAPHVLAHWYKRLLESSEEARKFQIGETMARHTDLLMSGIRESVSGFAARMVRADMGESPTAACKAYYEIDLSIAADAERAKLEHNAFVCSKDVEGHHLVTGHVFEADDRTWVCLTPACDLVPGQAKPDRHGPIGDRLPFIAVRLEPVALPAKKLKVNSNRYMFFRRDGAVQAFSLSKDAEDSNPAWFSLYAEKQGRIRGKAFTFTRGVVDREGRLKVKSFRARVIAQLRYDYALSFMQKLGSSMNRVGLDFV